MKRTLSWTLMLILALGGLTLVGCDDDDTTTGPALQVEPTVFGIVMSEGDGPKAFTNPGSAIIAVNNAPAVPGVTVNGAALGLEPELVYYSGSFAFYGQYEVPANGAAAVAVDLGVGDLGAAAAVFIPDDSEWLAPASGDTSLAYGQPLTVTWTAADNADSYWATWYFEIRYRDNDDLTQYYYNEATVFVSGTELTIAAADIWPPAEEVTAIENLYGDFDLMPVNGPMLTGDLPNVTGDATGFVIASGMMLDLDFYLGGAPAKSEDRERELDVTKSLLEQLQR